MTSQYAQGLKLHFYIPLRNKYASKPFMHETRERHMFGAICQTHHYVLYTKAVGLFDVLQLETRSNNIPVTVHWWEIL